MLPTDFSKNATNAIHYALQLFNDEKCTFYLFNSYAPPVNTGTTMRASSAMEVVLDISKENSKKDLESTLETLLKTYSNPLHTYQTVSRYDYFLGAVKDAVKEFSIDLIVMGTKGASGLKEVVMGSNTAEIIGYSNCHVLAVPEGARFKPLQEIAFVTNFDFYFNKWEVTPLTELARKFNASIKIMNVDEKRKGLTEDQKAVKNHLENLLKGYNHEIFTLSGANVDTATRLFTQSRNIDLITMVTRKYSFFERLFHKPKAEEISYHTSIPLLVLNPQEG